MKNTALARKTTALALVVAATLVLAACPPSVRIGDLAADPGRYYNKEVSVSGTVTQSYGALGTGAYELEDGSGKIWVISENYGTPSRGARVGVTGSVIQGASFGGRTFGLALRETRRRH
ncbi:MAG TPA: OB-fold nucleic acid binding domain-containing protein [Terriglobales bacterium]|nr:OB-fold nucleic acid binding domain-containing protein [Terriglobales bacterium]